MPKLTNVYFKSLYKMNLKVLFLIYLVPLFADIMQIIFKAYIISDGIDLRKIHRVFLVLIMVLIGNSHSREEFDGLISIRGDRKAFLKGCILAMIGNSIVLGVVDGGVMNMITYIGSRPKMHDFLCFVYYDFKDIGINIVLCLWATSLGFFIGSVDYRLTRNLFVIFMGAMIYIFYQAFIRESLGVGHYLSLQNVLLQDGILRYVWWVPLFILGGILVLYKAPIKAYVHSFQEG